MERAADLLERLQDCALADPALTEAQLVGGNAVVSDQPSART